MAQGGPNVELGFTHPGVGAKHRTGPLFVPGSFPWAGASSGLRGEGREASGWPQLSLCSLSPCIRLRGRPTTPVP